MRIDPIFLDKISQQTKKTNHLLREHKEAADHIIIGTPGVYPEPPLVYLLKEQGPDGYIKIGVSMTSAKNRLDSLQIGNARPLKILAVLQNFDAAGLERLLHRRFKSCRMKGEWFNLSKAQIMDILTDPESLVTFYE